MIDRRCEYLTSQAGCCEPQQTQYGNEDGAELLRKQQNSKMNAKILRDEVLGREVWL